MENVNNFIEIKTNSKLRVNPEEDFFRVWVEFLKPVHKLTKREMDVLAGFLKKRYQLGKVINDANVLDKVLMSEEVKKEIRTECNLSSKHFQVVMCKLKRNEVIKDDRIFPYLIPLPTEEGAGLLVYFNFKDEQRIKLGNPASGVKSED